MASHKALRFRSRDEKSFSSTHPYVLKRGIKMATIGNMVRFSSADKRENFLLHTLLPTSFPRFVETSKGNFSKVV